MTVGDEHWMAFAVVNAGTAGFWVGWVLRALLVELNEKYERRKP